MMATEQPKTVFVPHKPNWHQRLLAWMIVVVAKIVAGTLRFRFEDRSGFTRQPSAEQAIFCIWHNRLALCMQIYFGHARKNAQTSGMAVMVSASKDGAFLAAILQGFGVQPVRGSSSRRGPQAMLELTSWAEKGFDLALTPDGPRGPRYVAQDGAMSLAQLTGLPIIPVTYNLNWKIVIKSWDRFQIPLPFARCDIILEKPIRVPREATDEERDSLRTELEATLKAISND